MNDGGHVRSHITGRLRDIIPPGCCWQWDDNWQRFSLKSLQVFYWSCCQRFIVIHNLSRDIFRGKSAAERLFKAQGDGKGTFKMVWLELNGLHKVKVSKVKYGGHPCSPPSPSVDHPSLQCSFPLHWVSISIIGLFYSPSLRIPIPRNLLELSINN